MPAQTEEAAKGERGLLEGFRARSPTGRWSGYREGGCFSQESSAGIGHISSVRRKFFPRWVRNFCPYHFVVVTRRVNVVMYSRATCALCQEARAVIEAARRGTSFDFREVLIDGHPDLEDRYGLRVPVVEVNGREEFEYQIEPARLAVVISAAARAGGA